MLIGGVIYFYIAPNPAPTYLDKVNEEYEVITVTSTGINKGEQTIYSESRGILVSNNGYHVGVVYKEKAYCTIHPFGMQVNAWVDDK